MADKEIEMTEENPNGYSLDKKTPEQQKKSRLNNPYLIAFFIIAIGIGLSFLYVAYPLKQPFDNITSSVNPNSCPVPEFLHPNSTSPP